MEGPVDENLSDNNFCVKGVVTAYREITPMALEVKQVYQNIKQIILVTIPSRLKTVFSLRIWIM